MHDCANDAFVRSLAGVNQPLRYLSLEAAAEGGMGPIDPLPRSLKVMVENILFRLPSDQARAQIAALRDRDESVPVSFMPGRALLQDFMGIPLMTDMASMRDAVAAKGGDPARVDPVIPVDFVVDHSLNVLVSGRSDALVMNRKLELERNHERFAFIKWCQENFGNFRVIPPGRGIMHQVNLEWLSHVVERVEQPSGPAFARPDTMIGTDSHTTMVNALGVLGWGVGGIEAEMAMLGSPIEMAAPRVVGIRLTGALRDGATATDLVLHMAEFLRGIGVVGAFVEFHGEGVGRLPLADRATIANMSPEHGATCTYFPVDRLTIDYLRMTGRDERHLERVEAYCRAQGLWQDPDVPFDGFEFDENHSFDLGQVEPSMSGPTRPEERVSLSQVPATFEARLNQLTDGKAKPETEDRLGHGSVVIAAITSCTNTSNPEVMMAAGLLARNAVKRGLKPKPWVKTSLSPGSRVVTDYLTAAGFTDDLDALGFQTVGYGCATCNGNSGPLAPEIAERINGEALCTVGVLSGNRNFEGRIHPQIKGGYLASPPLVIAAALTGTVNRDLSTEPLGTDPNGESVYLRDIWPDRKEIAEHVIRYVTAERFTASYAKGMETTEDWEALQCPQGIRFPWNEDSEFILPSPFPDMGSTGEFGDAIGGIRPLVVLGDGITTDHISPNGAIRPDSPAGKYLVSRGADPERLGNFGVRRGNADVCARGMFDNALLGNELMRGERGNWTLHQPSGERLPIYEAGRKYAAEGTPTIIVAGRGYGAGSSRDWAAKGLRLLGVVAVLVESFERIHRSNLVGMGILPLAFPEGVDRQSLGLTGREELRLDFTDGALAPNGKVGVQVSRDGAEVTRFDATLMAFSDSEITMIKDGGVLPSIMSKH